MWDVFSCWMDANFKLYMLKRRHFYLSHGAFVFCTLILMTISFIRCKFLGLGLLQAILYTNLYIFEYALQTLPHLSWKLKWAFLSACCPSVCLSISKLFTFSSSSSEPLEPISTKLGTKHPWVKGVHVCSNRGPCPLLRRDNNELGKNINKIFKKSSSPEALGQTWHKASVGEGDLVCTYEGPHPFPRGDIMMK